MTRKAIAAALLIACGSMTGCTRHRELRHVQIINCELFSIDIKHEDGTVEELKAQAFGKPDCDAMGKGTWTLEVYESLDEDDLIIKGKQDRP